MRQQLLVAAVGALLVDRLTGEVAGLFSDADIECMLVKGPVIGTWLYPDSVRAYGDSDLLIARSDWERAVALLNEHGFQDYLGPLAHPRMESFASTAFLRGTDNVDLHCTIAGLEAPPQEVWAALSEGARRLDVGGRSMAIPSRPAVLMHIALHAAQHHDNPKTLKDLRRAIAVAEEAEWRQAAALARRLGGVAAFASGLRYAAEGSALASRLEVSDAGSVHFDLRASGVPTAEALHELLGAGLTLRERAARVVHELFPNPDFMRWWAPVARRGTAGLVASYPLRWSWLAWHLPRGLLELLRARRRRGRDGR